MILLTHPLRNFGGEYHFYETYEYLKNGNKKTASYDMSNGLIKIEWIENPNGLLLFETIFQDGQEKTTTEYFYDPQGRIIEEFTYNYKNNLVTNHFSYIYDNKGNVLEEYSFVDSPSGIQPVQIKSIIKHNYQYDLFGNWIKDVIETRIGSGADIRNLSVVYRKIDYFETETSIQDFMLYEQ